VLPPTRLRAPWLAARSDDVCISVDRAVLVAVSDTLNELVCGEEVGYLCDVFTLVGSEPDLGRALLGVTMLATAAATSAR